MDWPAWGPTLVDACDEFATAIAQGWPAKAPEASTLLRHAMNGALEAEEAFGLLQDLVPEDGAAPSVPRHAD